MAIEGPLRELGIHDVFQLLDLSRKTGRLRVSSALRDNQGTVFFKDGRVVSAFIKSNPHPLGTILVREGRISDADLARARNVQQIPGETRRLGEIMVSLGMISRRELERQVRHQIEVVVFELLSWQEGFFSFAEEDLPDDGAEGIASVTTESLLMEGARRLDEWTRVQQRVPHLGVIPGLAVAESDHAPKLELLPSEWEVLAAVDGRSDLRQIAERLKRSEFDVARVVFGLLTTAIVELRDPVPVSPPLAPDLGVAGCMAAARSALNGDQLDEGLRLAAAAVLRAPNDADARALLGRALLRTGRDVEGEEELRLALDLDPRHQAALMEAARLAAKRGELERAIALWQRIVAARPDSPLAQQARDAIAHASRLSAVLEAVDA
jgi:hypothetical protein